MMDRRQETEDWRKFLDPKRVSRIADLKLVARLVVEGFIAGLHRSPYHGFSVEFAEHREYVPGDDLRAIDWKVWGRTDKYYVKEYEEETNLKACLVLDGSASMEYKTGELSKLDYARSVAAALGYLMIRQSDSVGLAVGDTQLRRYIPPRCNASHLTVLLREMARLPYANRDKKEKAGTAISTVLHSLAERMKRRGLVVVLSDLWEEPSEVVRGLHHLRYRGHEVILFHILDEAEWNFPFAGATTFVDAETGEELPTDATILRNEYMNLAGEWRRYYSRECSQCRIDYLPVNTTVPFDRVLAGYLVRRSRLY